MESLFKQLDEIIAKYDKIIIMAHAKPDLDAYGSSLGLYEILKSKQKDVAIFLNMEDELHSSVKEAINLSNDINYVDQNSYKNYINENTLLIILDVHQRERIYFDIIDEVKDVMVIDHHMKSKNYIQNAILFYNNTWASSICEIITYYAKYLDYKFSSQTSTIMLAGIETDTNSYNLKTSSKTHYAASKLMKNGADNILKQELLKVTKEDYLKRADFIKTSFLINDSTAACILNKSINLPEDLSNVAEEMLKFENITLSIAIGRLDNKTIGISAKSIGNIDACKIMKHFNGGGHFNNAAAQVKDGNIKNILETIKNMLEV